MENKKIPTAKIPPEAEDDNSQQQRGFFFALKISRSTFLIVKNTYPLRVTPQHTVQHPRLQGSCFREASLSKSFQRI